MNPRKIIVLSVAAAVPLLAQIEVVSNGNVGIGTTTPSEQLTLGTSADSPNIKIARWAFFGQEASHLTTVLGNNVRVSGDSTVVAESNSADGYRAVRLKYNEGITFHAYLGAVTAGSVISNERMRITPAGNVGIGTTSPAGQLHLNGSGHTTLILDTSGQNSPYLSFRQLNAELAYIQYQDNGAGTDYLTYSAPAHSFHGGNVGIGTASPSYKLHVNGTVRGSSFISDTTTYADFVFKPDYQLPALSEVEAHIKECGHLPGIPSEAEAREEGIDLAAMQVKLLQKVEELTLYVIELEKRDAEMRREIQCLQSSRP